MDPSTPSLEDEALARIGTTLRGKWRLDALLGVGGMAAVYAATHRNGMRGAVKMLHKTQSQDPETCSRFLREGYIANRVDHAGAVRVLDDDVTEDGVAFLVMELLEGSALHERAGDAGGRLPVDLVLLVADQLLDVLAAAHDKGVVHRDVKPENIFLTVDGRVKVLDFGIARITESTDLMPTTTMAGSPMGTPAFMAPEQARGRWDLVGPQSDLWAVGATMFTLLSSQFVHEEETVQELLAAVFTKPARSLAVAAPGEAERVVEIVDRALSLKSADRWDDARAMQCAVRGAYRAITGEDMPAPPVATTVYKSEPPPRIRVSLPRHHAPLHVAGTISSAATELPMSLAPKRTRRIAALAAAAVAAAGFAAVTMFSGAAVRAAGAPVFAAATHVVAQGHLAALNAASREPEAIAPAAVSEPVTKKISKPVAFVASALASPASSAPSTSAASAIALTANSGEASASTKGKRAPTTLKTLFDRRH